MQPHASPRTPVPLACSHGPGQLVPVKPERKAHARKDRGFKATAAPEPEATLDAAMLRAGGVLGPLGLQQSAVGWKLVLRDDLRRTFVSRRKEAFTSEVLREWWQVLLDSIKWTRPRKDDWVIPRSTAWMTSDGCTCSYAYGGLKIAATPMEAWFIDITEHVSRTCGLKSRPDSCNANYYDDGNQTVGWHADDEPLFCATTHDSLIVSLSLGARRQFQLHPKDNPKAVTSILLEHGDLCTMEGLCQKHYRHRVPREVAVKGPRINLTWRWILRHESSCTGDL